MRRSKIFLIGVITFVVALCKFYLFKFYAYLLQRFFQEWLFISVQYQKLDDVALSLQYLAKGPGHEKF